MEYLNHVVVLTGLAVMLVQQVLKLKVVPVGLANKYPVPTLIVLSVIGSALAVWQDLIAKPAVWTDWVQLVMTVGVVAAVVYNNTLRNWGQLRDLEGEK